MPRVRSSPCHRNAFTLIELLVVIVIIAVLVAIALPIYSQLMVKSRQTTTMSNMRQLGIAFVLYANDNNYQLPGRTTKPDEDKWPKLLADYLGGTQVYVAPIPGYTGTTQEKNPKTLVDNGKNFTPYIANGYNDLKAYDDDSVRPRLNTMAEPGKVVLLGIQKPGKYNYYMDFYENNENDVLSRTPWPTGSVYVFCDGSSRFLKYRSTDAMKSPPINGDYYTDWLWLVDKSKTDIINTPGSNP